jgi:hypothetical protein
MMAGNLRVFKMEFYVTFPFIRLSKGMGDGYARVSQTKLNGKGVFGKVLYSL